MLAVSCPGLASGMWKECLWTVEGFLVCEGAEAGVLDLRVDEKKPGVPEKLVIPAAVEELAECLLPEGRLSHYF